MNGLKPMLLMVVLGGILYVVYVVINRGPATDPPPGVSKDWAKLPDVQMPPDGPGMGPGAMAQNGMGQNGMAQNGMMTQCGPGYNNGLGQGNPAYGGTGAGGTYPGAAAGRGMDANNMPPGAGQYPYSGGANGAGPYGNGSSGAGQYSGGPNGMSPYGGSPSSTPPGGSGQSAYGSQPPWPGQNPYGPSGGPSNKAPGGGPSSPDPYAASPGDPGAADPFNSGRDASSRGATATHDPAAGTVTPTADFTPDGGGLDFSATMANAKRMAAEHKLAEALQLLTMLHDNPRLAAQDAVELNDWLGRLAGTVVYSRESLMLPAYVVRPGDRLEQIAEQYRVPARLLAKINGVTDPNNLTPGDKLKVIRGPFSGTVDLGHSELILSVQHCYAGRFRITRVGREVAKLGGGYDVNEKLLDPTYHAPDAAPPDTASLKIHHWVGFGDKFGLRAVADPSVAEDPRALDLDGRDAEDVFDILSLGSRIVIRK